MTTKDIPELKVGDKLAFKHSYQGWIIHKIEKITPSGRIKCADSCYMHDPEARAMRKKMFKYTKPQLETIRTLAKLGYKIRRRSLWPLMVNAKTGKRVEVAFDGRQVCAGWN